MDFGLTEEQHLLVSTIRAFVRDELKPLEVQVERDGKLDDSIADDLRHKSQALGLYAVNIPAEYGGGGLSVLDWMIAEEQFGWTSDILKVNGFDERMQYGGQDRELGERLVNSGIKGKQIRYSAICVHLDHPRGYKTQESIDYNRSIRKNTRDTKSTYTKFGINKS